MFELDVGTVVAIVIAVASPVIAWLVQSKMFEAKVAEWRQSVAERLERIERTQSQTEIAAFRAMDEQREQDWVEWRAGLERRLSEIVKGNADWRHNEYSPESRKQSAAIATMQEQINGLKERADRLERKVFNGSGRPT